MVRTEIWSCLLARNLIRLKMLRSSAVNVTMPRAQLYDDAAIAGDQLAAGQCDVGRRVGSLGTNGTDDFGDRWTQLG